jgi:hypothetical protein
LREVTHEVGVTFIAEPSIPRKYPALILDPFLSFFFAVAPSSVFRTVFSDSGTTYQGKLIISLYKQGRPLFSSKNNPTLEPSLYKTPLSQST